MLYSLFVKGIKGTYKHAYKNQIRNFEEVALTIQRLRGSGVDQLRCLYILCDSKELKILACDSSPLTSTSSYLYYCVRLNQFL